jgi:hypothetical protein
MILNLQLDKRTNKDVSLQVNIYEVKMFIFNLNITIINV